MTLSLGALNQCRRLRWTIEKARAADRHLPTKLYQALYWPTEVSLQFIPLAYG